MGLPRKATRTSPPVTVTFPGRIPKPERWGWDDIKALQDAGNLPDGTTIEYTVQDDTVPNGPVTRTKRLVAPFATANREEDYRIAWDFFQNKAH